MRSAVANGKTKKFPTSVGIKPETREKVCKLLNQHLADTFDLLSQTKQAHWNVKGPHFYPLHKMFDTFAEGLVNYTDMIAERITSLGGIAYGTARMAAANSALPEYPADILEGTDHVRALVERYAQYGDSIRANIDPLQKMLDNGTADMLTEIERDVTQWLWFLEAHIQV